MKTPTTIIPDWSAFGRFFVNENCLYFGKKYKNLTGINSEPGVGFDWALEEVSGGDGSSVMKHTFIYAGVNEVTLPEAAREILDFQVDNGCGYDIYITSFTPGSNEIEFDAAAMGLSSGNRLKFIYIKQ